MRKKVLLFLLIFSVMLGALGCRRQALPGIVVRADVTYQHQGETIYRCYTQPEKLSGLLSHLRNQEFRGYAQIDPEKIEGDRCRIELTRTDGTKAVILQNANLYRSTDYRRWEKVDQAQAEKLYPFLLEQPGDVSGT